jgi:hypothetical protein
MLDQVAPALNNHGAMNTMYAPRDPVEDTPTGATLASVTATLAAFNQPGPKAIILATDGEPDTCLTPDPDGLAAAKSESLTAAQAAFGSGIETHVISVGADVSQAHLQDLANAGQGLAIGGAVNAPYYQALNAGQLVNAFDSIITGVRSCSYSLDGQVDLSQADTGTVILDGVELQLGVGWQLTDPTTLELIGSACDSVLDGGDHDLSATFSCSAVVL